jgi:hypothetical protein
MLKPLGFFAWSVAALLLQQGKEAGSIEILGPLNNNKVLNILPKTIYISGSIVNGICIFAIGLELIYEFTKLINIVMDRTYLFNPIQHPNE